MLERQLEFVRHHFLTREFILFIAVGTFNTFLCSFLAYMFNMVVANSNIAFNMGYITCNVVSYTLNSHLIFYEPMTWKRYVKFALSYVPNYIVQNTIVFIFYNLLGWPNIVSFLLAAVLGVPVTFLFVKIFAFGRR